MQILIVVAALAVVAVTPFLSAPQGGLSAYEEAPVANEAEESDAA